MEKWWWFRKNEIQDRVFHQTTAMMSFKFSYLQPFNATNPVDSEQNSTKQKMTIGDQQSWTETQKQPTKFSWTAMW